MKRFAVVVLLPLLLGGCAGGKTAVRSEEEQARIKARFKELEAREATNLNLTGSEGPLRVKVLSTGPVSSEVRKEEELEQYVLHIPIGSSISADCYVTEQIAFPSVVLKSIFDNIGTLPTIEGAGVKKIDAGVMNNMGYLYLEAEYLTRQKSYGTAKVIALTSVNASLYCMHDELGYRETFLKVVRSLIDSGYIQDLAGDIVDYRKRQIDVIYLNGMAIGFSDDLQLDEEGGTRKELSFGSMLLPRETNQLMTDDSWDTTIYNIKTGEVQSGSYYSYSNNETEYEIELEKGGKGRYRVSGVFQGKPLDQELKAEKGLTASGFVFDRFLRGKAPAKRWEYDEYVPLAPLEATKSRMELKEKEAGGGRRLEYAIQPVTVLMHLDKDSYSQAEMAVGNLSFEIKRRYIDVRQR